jgi:hypothetical protein
VLLWRVAQTTSPTTNSGAASFVNFQGCVFCLFLFAYLFFQDFPLSRPRFPSLELRQERSIFEERLSHLPLLWLS